MNRKRIISILFMLFIANSCDTSAWEVVRGGPDAWELDREELTCRVESDQPHWILSKQTIEDNWILKAEIQSSISEAAQGILFNIGENISHGFLLTLEGNRLNLSRLSQKNIELIQTWPIHTNGEENRRQIKIAKRGAHFLRRSLFKFDFYAFTRRGDRDFSCLGIPFFDLLSVHGNPGDVVHQYW